MFSVSVFSWHTLQEKASFGTTTRKIEFVLFPTSLSWLELPAFLSPCSPRLPRVSSAYEDLSQQPSAITKRNIYDLLLLPHILTEEPHPSVSWWKILLPLKKFSNFTLIVVNISAQRAFIYNEPWLLTCLWLPDKLRSLEWWLFFVFFYFWLSFDFSHLALY